MQVTIRRADLVEGLELLKEMCPIRFLELGRGVLVTATDHSVVLEMTDDIHWGRVVLDRVAVGSQGKVATDPRLLSDLVRKLEEDEVELVADRRSLLLRASQSKYALRVFDTDLCQPFPDFPMALDIITERRTFAKLVERVAFLPIADPTLGKPALAGVFLEATDSILALSSSDGVRYVRGTVPAKMASARNFSFLLHPQTLKRVAALSLLAGSEVEIGFSENCVYIVCGMARFRSPLLEGHFPSTQGLYASVQMEACIETDAPPLGEAISRLLLFAEYSPNHPIRLSNSNTSSLLTTKTETGLAEETIGVRLTSGKPFHVTLNGKLFAEIISRVKAPTYEIKYYGAWAPVCVVPSDEKSLTVWMLPLKG
jgi:DNA polymerase III sliding clamp (beta) subunit (PCNA family)